MLTLESRETFGEHRDKIHIEVKCHSELRYNPKMTNIDFEQ